MIYPETLYPALMAILIVHIYITFQNSKKLKDLENTISSLKKETE